MPSKDFKGALNRQRTTGNETTGRGRLGVVGEVPNPIREELERATEQLPVQEVELEKLHDNPFQHLARPVMNEETLNELADSIRSNGFYGALLARRRKGKRDEYELAYGHRRREAARRAGLKTVPVKVVELSDSQMARIMASENFSREDLTPLGEAQVVGYLYNDQNMTVNEVAEVIGKKRGWIEQRLTLYGAPQDVKEMVEQKRETMSHARLLVSVNDSTQRSELIQNILEHNLTFEQVRNHLETLKQAANTKTKVDNNFTISSTDGNCEEFHNASRESTTINERASREELRTHEQAQRADALRRLVKAADKFDNLIERNDYRLTDDEKLWVGKIVESLSALLDHNEHNRNRTKSHNRAR
ncbi:MAG TPA: ParB/RepB/Spo0J family partition protein [Chloroflexia bacterium]|nr:ParB/RepB/Spo0J family partition protein [Chloroflexia bacterium]